MSQSGLKHSLVAAVALAVLGAGRPARACEPPERPPKPRVAHEVVTYDPIRGLKGWLFWPGDGERPSAPHPVVLWNHGSESNSRRQVYLAKFFTDHGFLFFQPLREGVESDDGVQSPGKNVRERQEAIFDAHPGWKDDPQKKPAVQREVMELHQYVHKDVQAALRWIRAQPFVKRDEVVVTGVSFGGIQAALTGPDCLARAIIPFAPAAMSWVVMSPPLEQMLTHAIQETRQPVFLIQAENDFDLAPSHVLGPLVKAKGPENRARIYPKFGCTHMHGHGAFAILPSGINIWGDEVLAFIREGFKAKLPACASEGNAR
jgi:hypothetical protein